MDARRGFGASDQVMLEYAEARGRPVHVLLTKSDKLGRNEARSTLQKTRALLGGRASVQLFSAESGEGLAAAQGAMEALLAGRHSVQAVGKKKPDGP